MVIFEIWKIKKKAASLAKCIKQLIDMTITDKKKGKTYRKNIAGPCFVCVENEDGTTLYMKDKKNDVSDENDKKEANTKKENDVSKNECSDCNESSLVLKEKLTYEKKHHNTNGNMNNISEKNGDESNESKNRGNNKSTTKKRKCQISVCASCCQRGHARSSHLDCLMLTNPKSKHFRKYPCLCDIVLFF